MTIRARRLLVEPGRSGCRTDQVIHLAGDRIAAVEPDLAGPAAESLLVLPALVDAHDHGRGLRGVSYGAFDQALETWSPAINAPPYVDPYLGALTAFARLVRSGVGSIVHCHAVQRPDALQDELAATARAAEDLGIRLALVVPMRDQNGLAYGPDDALLELVDPVHRPAVVTQWQRKPRPAAMQIELARAVRAACESERVTVQLGPVGPQWCSPALLDAIAAESAATGMRVHMHLLETRYQREWADHAMPGGLLPFLDRIGLLSPRLTVAHGVWLRPDEIALLAARGVILSVNSCSNLRLRSGIAPVRAMLAAGLRIAVGVDGFSYGDEDDALRDLQLAFLLHNGPGFEGGLTAGQLMTAACRTGAGAFRDSAGFGAVAPGMAADLLALDYDALAADVVEPLSDAMELLLTRAAARHVRHLWVAGRPVLRDGRIVTVDAEAAEREAIGQARANAGPVVDRRPALLAYQSALRRFYGEGRHMRTPISLPPAEGSRP